MKAVQSALRHSSARETLDTYAHLWPSDEDQLRHAVDRAFGQPQTDQRQTTGHVTAL